MMLQSNKIRIKLSNQEIRDFDPRYVRDLKV
jgi:hypothetical protein